MRIIAKKALVDFYTLYPDTKLSLEDWYRKTIGKDSKKNRCLYCFLLHFLKNLFVYQKYFYTFVVKNSL